jgi:hypothetical protein
VGGGARRAGVKYLFVIHVCEEARLRVEARHAMTSASVGIALARLGEDGGARLRLAAAAHAAHEQQRARTACTQLWLQSEQSERLLDRLPKPQALKLSRS